MCVHSNSVVSKSFTSVTNNLLVHYKKIKRKIGLETALRMGFRERQSLQKRGGCDDKKNGDAAPGATTRIEASEIKAIIQMLGWLKPMRCEIIYNMGEKEFNFCENHSTKHVSRCSITPEQASAPLLRASTP